MYSLVRACAEGPMPSRLPTEMWLLLSLVKGSRFQSLQRSRKSFRRAGP